jgi:DHA1 family multidrug resistance protein-like MFS transporter
MGMSLAGLLPAINKLARQAVAEGGAGQMLGYLQSAQSAGMVLGPLLGGVVAVHLGLGSVFYVTGALLIACALVAEQARRQ